MTDNGLGPMRYDLQGTTYTVGQLVRYMRIAIESEGYFFTKKARVMSKDAEQAIELTEDVTKKFKSSVSNLLVVEQEFVQQSRKIAGEVKDASEKIGQGIQRIEKAANFDRLERYVDLLERAATAMTLLGELEKTGKLDKIASAIR